MIEKDGRFIEELPKNLNVSKKEFERMFNLMISKIKEKCADDKKSELEEYAVVFALIQEFYLFLDRYEEQVTVHMKELMDELNEYKVSMSKFGKTLKFDKEVNWFYLSDMNKSEWLEFDKKCNEEFLKKRIEKQVLNGQI